MSHERMCVSHERKVCLYAPHLCGQAAVGSAEEEGRWLLAMQQLQTTQHTSH
jgi:hypothetical protein